jgi:hypothetical protein
MFGDDALHAQARVLVNAHAGASPFSGCAHCVLYVPSHLQIGVVRPAAICAVTVLERLLVNSNNPTPATLVAQTLTIQMLSMRLSFCSADLATSVGHPGALVGRSWTSLYRVTYGINRRRRRTTSLYRFACEQTQIFPIVSSGNLYTHRD